MTSPVGLISSKLRRLAASRVSSSLETEKVPRKRAGAPVGSGPGLGKADSAYSPQVPWGTEGSVEESEAEASGEEEGMGPHGARPGPRRLVSHHPRGPPYLTAAAPSPLGWSYH